MLDEIGFYTMTDARAENASSESDLIRCELIITGRCNFKCPYCRHIGGEDLSLIDGLRTLDLWAEHGLRNIRFSGGEPTLHDRLADFISHAKFNGAERIAISTNGSASLRLYESLIRLGLDDISVSLDACCAEDFHVMSGRDEAIWHRLKGNIRALAKQTYVTVGIVITNRNRAGVGKTIELAHELGVDDIRMIPSAQSTNEIVDIRVSDKILDCHPILKYRVGNMNKGIPFRGLPEDGPNRCRLMLDDMAVMGGRHYPCIIYMREGGPPIGNVSPHIRNERAKWSDVHNIQLDPICKFNCLDVCVKYNKAWEVAHEPGTRCWREYEKR